MFHGPANIFLRRYFEAQLCGGICLFNVEMCSNEGVLLFSFCRHSIQEGKTVHWTVLRRAPIRALHLNLRALHSFAH